MFRLGDIYVCTVLTSDAHAQEASSRFACTAGVEREGSLLVFWKTSEKSTARFRTGVHYFHYFVSSLVQVYTRLIVHTKSGCCRPLWYTAALTPRAS